MSPHYRDHVIRIDQLFTGRWRVQMVEPTGRPLGDHTTTFPDRTSAWGAARTLSVWFGVEVEEVL